MNEGAVKLSDLGCDLPVSGGALMATAISAVAR